MSLPEGDVVRPPRKFEKIVVRAAEWIEDNLPPHVTDSNRLQYGMSMGAQRFCSFGSSFVHGYMWMRDYVAGKARHIGAYLGSSRYRGATPKSCHSGPTSHVNLRCTRQRGPAAANPRRDAAQIGLKRSLSAAPPRRKVGHYFRAGTNRTERPSRSLTGMEDLDTSVSASPNAKRTIPR